jgi:ribonucleoside-triphosphate reductase
MKVIKRNGDEVNFDLTKIESAIRKANFEVEKKHQLSEDDVIYIANQVKKTCISKRRALNVEEIQDIVENKLIQYNYAEVARHYIKYRFKRTMARDKYNELMDAVSDKVQAKNIQNQNANVDERSFGGRIGEMSSLIMKQYALDYCMSDMAKKNHLSNKIYIHDLDSYAVGSHNCLTIPFDKLLAEGFNTRQTDVRPANSLNTAMQLVAVIFQLQSLQQFGGVSASHLDWTMVPYVRKSFYKHFKDGVKHLLGVSFDKYEGCIDVVNAPINDDFYKSFGNNVYDYAMEMTEKECHQAVEALYHNLNTLQSRSGNQLPFTSINYGTCTLTEGRMVTKELLTVSKNGLGSLKKTSIFPCGIFQCMKGVNRKPGDPNYDLFRMALESTAQRLYPNYANVDWSGNAGYDVNDPKTYFSTINKSVA